MTHSCGRYSVREPDKVHNVARCGARGGRLASPPAGLGAPRPKQRALIGAPLGRDGPGKQQMTALAG